MPVDFAGLFFAILFWMWGTWYARDRLIRAMARRHNAAADGPFDAAEVTPLVMIASIVPTVLALLVVFLYDGAREIWVRGYI